MSSATVFLLIFAFCKQACDGVPVQGKAFNQRSFPDFMQNLYHRFLAGRAPFSTIVHSNAAIAVRRSNIAFEATFSDLGFLKHENLKRAKLRLNIPTQKHCTLPELNVRVIDAKSGQLFGDYVMFPQQTGVSSLLLTKSIQKLASHDPSKKLKVRVTLRNPKAGTSLCNVVSSLSTEAYLVTNTNEVKTRVGRSTDRASTSFRWRAEDVPSMFRVFSERRLKRNAPTCNMKTVTVNLTSSNNSIFILPPSFKTGVCGHQQIVPLSTDPMIQQLAKAVSRAVKGVAPTSNQPCCMPSKFRQLTVLYFDTAQHTVLRHVNKVQVTGCACSNNT